MNDDIATGTTLRSERAVAQQPSHKYAPNPKSTCDNGESNENTGMARRVTKTAEQEAIQKRKAYTEERYGMNDVDKLRRRWRYTSERVLYSAAWSQVRAQPKVNR
jgi:hypothetical protein